MGFNTRKFAPPPVSWGHTVQRQIQCQIGGRESAAALLPPTRFGNLAPTHRHGAKAIQCAAAVRVSHEPASTKPSRAEVTAIVQEIVAAIRAKDQDPMICDQVAVALQGWLIERGYRFQPWLYSTYDPRVGETKTFLKKHAYKKGPDGKLLTEQVTTFVENTMQGGEIYFNGSRIGFDTHLFTVVDTTEGLYVFDNVSTNGIGLAEFNARLTFYWHHGDGLDISIGLNEVRRVQVLAKTVRGAGSRAVIKWPGKHDATIDLQRI